MSVVANGHLVLLFDDGEKGTLVVNAEREYSVLVGDNKACTVDGAGFCPLDGLEVETVEGREHSEFELQGIFRRDLEGDVFVINVFGDLNVEDLRGVSTANLVNGRNHIQSRS